MTNKEAIEILNVLRNAERAYQYKKEEVNEALNLAIKALEQMQDLSSVKPQRAIGNWRDKKTTIKGAHGLAYGRWGCSICKRKFPSKSNYCPNCGAKMEDNK